MAKKSGCIKYGASLSNFSPLNFEFREFGARCVLVKRGIPISRDGSANFEYRINARHLANLIPKAVKHRGFASAAGGRIPFISKRRKWIKHSAVSNLRRTLSCLVLNSTNLISETARRRSRAIRKIHNRPQSSRLSVRNERIREDATENCLSAKSRKSFSFTRGESKLVRNLKSPFHRFVDKEADILLPSLSLFVRLSMFLRTRDCDSF